MTLTQRWADNKTQNIAVRELSLMNASDVCCQTALTSPHPELDPSSPKMTDYLVQRVTNYIVLLHLETAILMSRQCLSCSRRRSERSQFGKAGSNSSGCAKHRARSWSAGNEMSNLKMPTARQWKKKKKKKKIYPVSCPANKSPDGLRGSAGGMFTDVLLCAYCGSVMFYRCSVRVACQLGPTLSFKQQT